MKVALCLMVKDEEDNIEGCLDSVSGFYDKAFVTDVGSEDGTVEILEEREDVELSFCDFQDHFAKARNYNFEQVPEDYDWILWMDADDRVLDDKGSERFRNFLNEIPEEVNSVDMPYIWSHDENATGRIVPKFRYSRKRLIRNNGSCKWKGFIHEHPSVEGESMQWEGVTFHHMREGDGKENVERNLRIFEKHMDNLEDLDEARYRFYYGKELTYADRYEEAEEQFKKYLPLSNWIPEKARAFYELAEIKKRDGKYDEAREWCFKCIKLEPHNSDAYTLLSWMAYEEEDYQSAFLWAFHAYNSDERDTKFFDYVPSSTWEPLELMAWSRYEQGRLEEALSLIDEALEYASENEYMQQTKKKWLEEISN